MTTTEAPTTMIAEDPGQGLVRNTAAARPIFVVGSLRSGASLLTLCLGQHPHIRQVAEIPWFGHFVETLHHAYSEEMQGRFTSQIAASGIEVEDFFAHFGDAIDRLMLTQHAIADGQTANGLQPNGGPDSDYRPARWVDGTQANSMLAFPLLRLFPAAKFIHVLREVDEVVASLTSEENVAHYKSHHILMTSEAAYEHWMTAVGACVEAERAFGSETVLRIRRADLVGDPENTLRSCLTFLDEPFEPTCLRPFR